MFLYSVIVLYCILTRNFKFNHGFNRGGGGGGGGGGALAGQLCTDA